MGSVVVSTAIALVLWGNFAYKLRRFRGRPRNDAQRANFATLLSMALAFTILDPPIYTAIDAVTGVPNLARLLGNVFGVAGACAFEPVAAAVAKRAGHGGGVWGNWWFMGATLLIMAMLFFAARLPTSEPTAGFPVRYDALPAVAAYRLVFLGSIGLTLCRLFVLWRRVSVAAALSGDATQRQARLQTVGWALGAAYCGYECGYILLRATGAGAPMLYSSVVAYGLLVGCFALILNDGFVTALQWVERYRAYRELGALWRALVAAFPDLALDSPRRRGMATTVFADLDFQLRRRVTEIRDGVMTLQPFLDRGARDRAWEYYHACACARVFMRQDVEALTLAAAIAAKRRGQRARDRLAESLLPDATDFDTDLRHLRAVAAAFHRLSPEDIMAVTLPNTDPREDLNAEATGPVLPSRTRKVRVARVLTEVFAPSPVGVVALVVVAWRFSPTPLDAVKWLGVSAAFVVVFPLALLLWRIRHGQVTDIHVRRRDQRLPVILSFLASWCAGIVTLTLLGAPPPLVALIGAGMTALVVTGIITLRWKISLHVGVAAGVLTVGALLFGPQVLLAAPLIPVLGWARVTLSDHTPWQVTAGALIGAAVSGIAFTVVTHVLT